MEKLGFTIDNKKILDYCSQFFFDVKNGIDNAKFLEVINDKLIENIEQNIIAFSGRLGDSLRDHSNFSAVIDV